MAKIKNGPARYLQMFEIPAEIAATREIIDTLVEKFDLINRSVAHQSAEMQRFSAAFLPLSRADNRNKNDPDPDINNNSVADPLQLNGLSGSDVIDSKNNPLSQENIIALIGQNEVTVKDIQKLTGEVNVKRIRSTLDNLATEKKGVLTKGENSEKKSTWRLTENYALNRE